MKPIPQSEIDLVLALQAGQATAFTTLYRAYSSTLFRVLLHLVGDQYRAEDLLQDAFVKIWLNIHQYDAQQSRLYTWLLIITQNLAYDELRAQKVQARAGTYIRERSSILVDPMASEGMINGSVLSLLAPKYRQILELAYTGSYTKSEIATTLNLPVGTVKTRFRTALQALQQFFSHDIDLYHRPDSGALNEIKKRSHSRSLQDRL